jgi:NMD protein affecting ribosome stability and mRNA decay
MRFCPKCGKKGIKGDFCSECSEDELELGFKDIVVKKCIECDRFMMRNAWKRFPDAEEGIASAARVKIKNPKKVLLNIVPRHEELKNKPGAKQDMELEIAAKRQDFIIPAVIEFTYCDKCSKKGTDYFEGTLQLRDVTPEVLNFVREDMAKHAVDGAHVTKEKGKGGNIDFKMTSTKYMRQLGKRLKQKFSGELTETVKLFTRNKQTSKEVYRTNVLFRLRKFKIGDIVESRGRKIKIKTMSKRVSGVDMDTGKKVFVD